MFDQSGVTVNTKTVMRKAPAPKAPITQSKQELAVSCIFEEKKNDNFT